MLQEELGRFRLQVKKTFLLHLHLDLHRHRHDFHQVLRVDFLQHFPVRNNNKKQIDMTTYFYSIPLKNSKYYLIFIKFFKWTSCSIFL